MPETCNIWGDPIEPADNIISFLAIDVINWLSFQYETLTAFLLSKLIFFTCAFVRSFKFFLFLIGFNYPTASLHLNPFFSVT